MRVVSRAQTHPHIESVRAHDQVMRTTRSMQSAYNRHAAGMQTAVATAVQVPAKEVPTEYLGNTLVLEYPTQVLEIAVVDRYSIKIDLEVRTVYKTKDRPSFKIRVLLLLVLSLHAVRLKHSRTPHTRHDRSHVGCDGARVLCQVGGACIATHTHTHTLPLTRPSPLEFGLVHYSGAQRAGHLARPI